jgi:hypothetical protein
MHRLINPFFVWWLHSARYPWSHFRRFFFEFWYRSTQLPQVSSVPEVKDNIDKLTWTRDGFFHLFDAVSYPERVWKTKKDDCDGFAILAAKLLKTWNEDTSPVLLTVLMWPMSKSHTVCVFKNDTGELSYFDNYTLKDGPFHSYDEIAGMVRGNKELICWDVADPEKLKTKEFHRVISIA